MDNEIEVMRVVRVPPLGKAVVEVRQQRYQSLNEIQAANLRQFLLAAIGDLISFAGGYDKLVDAGVAPPIAPPQQPQQATPPAQANPDLESERQEFLARLERERDALQAAMATPSVEDLVEESVDEGETAAEPTEKATEKPIARPAEKAVEKPVAKQPETQTKPKKKPAAKKPSPVEQIDAILQKHLQAHSQLAARSIHVRPAPKGGLQIEVDGQTYQRPAEIPGKEIQLAIKKALKEWGAN